MLSRVKKVGFPLLYPYNIRRHSLVKNAQTHTRQVAHCLCKVGDYEVSLSDCGTTSSTFEVPSFELLLFLHGLTNDRHGVINVYCYYCCCLSLKVKKGMVSMLTGVAVKKKVIPAPAVDKLIKGELMENDQDAMEVRNINAVGYS